MGLREYHSSKILEGIAMSVDRGRAVSPLRAPERQLSRAMEAPPSTKKKDGLKILGQDSSTLARIEEIVQVIGIGQTAQSNGFCQGMDKLHYKNKALKGELATTTVVTTLQTDYRIHMLEMVEVVEALRD